MANGNDSTRLGKRTDSFTIKSPKKKPGVYYACPLCPAEYLSESKRDRCEKYCRKEAARTRKERKRA